MPRNRSSGLDFSDGSGSIETLDQHPDLQDKASSNQMQRNKSERRRLQGLQRTLTTTSPSFPEKPNTFMHKFDLWMINEGGRQLFFGIWIFLHFLVAVFGFFHYQLKDNLTQARAMFGITFGACPLLIFESHSDIAGVYNSYSQDCRSNSPCRCHFHPPPSLS